MAKPGLNRKLVIVGDGACGKTSLLSVYIHGTFPKEHTPTVFENYVKDVVIDGKTVNLALWDTAGQEEYERLRPLSYSKANVILICYSVDSPDSLENVLEKWIDEVNSLCQGVPVILVGLKKDIRDGNTEQTNTKKPERLVQTTQGADVAAQIGARRFIECSALSGENVNEVFDKATRAAMFVGAGGAVDSESCCLIL
ncbi:Rho GTPase [Entomophthora muscae]|uniref:Rho GTPase n=2 Tax=Entomophthora muscae TaxID=34485 RepID=A0ACC2S6H9_9FUNG|nr:Rho GTPase [Entomophthora muscae]KAJ9057881.1 Rho GTPase [Entomophthora muscae]